ncbi:MAG TPA: terminase large subunit, partial [Pirellulales bacterium]|nr:terminase large subunit [Pirellulales bacterium]
MLDRTTRRWIRTSADERAAANGCRFDERAAAKVCEFFRRFLRHSKGDWASKPFEPLEWQRDHVLYPLFGWKRPDSTRRFRKAYVELPKKNGKSTLAAGIGLYMLVGDREAGAECYSAATDQKQASIVHNEACAMVDASPELSA